MNIVKSWILIPLMFMLAISLITVASPSSGQEEQGPPVPSYPQEATIGEGIVITFQWSGSILIEVQYPGSNTTWILEPEEETFELPAPYTQGEIMFFFNYSSNIDIYGENLTPSEQYRIPISGWSDGDGDGLDDSWEERYDVSDPDEDEDRDGLTNLDEMHSLTSPNKVDTDEDEMEDMWEYFHGTLPFRYDAYDDPDLDEWTNIKEMVKETDPRDPTDHPEEPPFTPWYWILLIIVVLLLILGYFVKQLFNKREFEDDMEDFDRKNSARKPPSRGRTSGKI